jgi:hypothetical protein
MKWLIVEDALSDGARGGSKNAKKDLMAFIAYII